MARLSARSFLTKSFATAFHYGGLASLLRAQQKSKVTILTYHSVRDHSRRDTWATRSLHLSVDLRLFQQQMEYIAAHYTTITLCEIARRRKDGVPLPKNSCVITFDDGYRGIYDNAFPVLKRLGL